MNPILWTPTNPQATQLAAFGRLVRGEFGGPTADDYPALHRWSLDRRGDFWRAVWRFAEVVGEPGETSYAPGSHMTDARWFPGGSLNFAENLLRTADDSPAIHFRTERGDSRTLTRRDLFAQATSFAGFLRSQGVKPGDRVAAVLPNVPEAVVAMLGTAAVGAVWSSCSPDFGEDAVVDRFGQIGPTVLVTCDRTTYAGKPVPVADKVRAVLPRLPTVRTVVVAGDIPVSPGWVRFADAVANPDPGFRFERFPFAHPLAVLYSSGTTGARSASSTGPAERSSST